MSDKDLLDAVRQLDIRWSRLAEIGWINYGAGYDQNYAEGKIDGEVVAIDQCAKKLRDLLGMEDADWSYDFNGDYSI